MLISELIEELQRYQAVNGNVEVRYSQTDEEGNPEGGTCEVLGVMDDYDDDSDAHDGDSGFFCLIY